MAGMNSLTIALGGEGVKNACSVAKAENMCLSEEPIPVIAIFRLKCTEIQMCRDLAILEF